MQEAKDANNIVSLNQAALDAKKKADESTAIAALTKTLKRSSESGISYVNGPVAPIHGGLLLGATDDFEVRYRVASNGSTYKSFHYGEDWAMANFRNPDDRVVVAADSGVVAAIDLNSQGYGQYVTIEHKNADGTVYYTRYAHITPDTDLKVGEPVTKGQQIALISGAGTQFGTEVKATMQALHVDENTAFEMTVNKYTDASGKWVGGSGAPTYPHLHFELTDAPKGAGSIIAEDLHQLFDATKNTVYQRGQTMGDSGSTPSGIALTVNFDDYTNAVVQTPQTQQKTYAENLYNTVLGLRDQVFPPIEKRTLTANGDTPVPPTAIPSTGDAKNPDPKKSLVDTIGCVGTALTSFDFGAAGGCLSGNNSSYVLTPSPSENSNHPNSNDQPDSSVPSTAKQAQTADLSVEATVASPTVWPEFKFQGFMTRVLRETDSSISAATDIQQNFSAVIENRLNLDYGCDGSVDDQTLFTVPYRSFDASKTQTTAPITAYLNVPDSGVYCFFFDIDTQNAITEPNEHDNTSNHYSFTASRG